MHQEKKKDDGVSYYNHFRKDFIRPYGLAHDEQSYDDATLTRRLNNWNCEFFNRPQIAISEFAETLLANFKYLQDNKEILDQKSFSAFIKKGQKIEEYLKILDTKQPNTQSIYICLQRYTPSLNLFIHICVY